MTVRRGTFSVSLSFHPSEMRWGEGGCPRSSPEHFPAGTQIPTWHLSCAGTSLQGIWGEGKPLLRGAFLGSLPWRIQQPLQDLVVPGGLVHIPVQRWALGRLRGSSIVPSWTEEHVRVDLPPTTAMGPFSLRLCTLRSDGE